MKCKRCGNCCYFNQVWDGEKVIRTNPCPHLYFVENVAVCAIYDTRPEICKFFSCDVDVFSRRPDLTTWSSKGVKKALGLEYESNN